MALLRRALGFAVAGIVHAWRTQRNLRIQTAIAAGVLATVLALRMPPVPLALIVLTIAVVLAAELFNTAIEATIDLVAPAPHPLARAAKDAAAGAVLVVSAGAVVVGLLVTGAVLSR